jgi:putative acetyltransferase
MTEIHVRPLEPADIAAFHYVHNHPRVVPEILQPPFISLEERKQQIASSLGERYLVAECGGQAAGFGDLRLFRDRRAHVGHIGLAVDPEHWGKGLGTALVEAMIDLGERWYGVRRIELKVFECNERAIRLYERFGFEIEATLAAFALREGVLATALTMARLKPVNER